MGKTVDEVGPIDSNPDLANKLNKASIRSRHHTNKQLLPSLVLTKCPSLQALDQSSATLKFKNAVKPLDP